MRFDESHGEVLAIRDLAPGLVRRPYWTRPRTRWEWLPLVGRVGLVWLPVYAVAFDEDPSILRAFGVSALLAAAWLVGIQSVLRASRLTLVAVGQGVAVAAGTALGLGAASGLAFWIPAIDLRPTSLLVMAGAIFLLTTAWEATLRRGLGARRVLIVGGGESTSELVEKLAVDSDRSFEILGVVDDESEEDFLSGVPVLGRVSDLGAIVRGQRPDLVVLSIDRNRPEAFGQLLEVAGAGFRVVGLPEFYEYVFGRVPVRHLSAAWFMSTLHLYQHSYTRLTKRTFDITVALFGLLLTAPLFLVLALLVRQSRGPIIFRQARLGEAGRLFTIFKFRTMRDDAEEPGQPVWAEEKDPRATRVGRLLRMTRLDELPQLWNVLRGDMSIVGPRPERPEFFAMLEEEVPFWTRRHLLKPGITGWAQVRSSYAADFLSTEEKLSYDLWYLRHRSLVIDLIICAKTLPRLVAGSGAR